MNGNRLFVRAGLVCAALVAILILNPGCRTAPPPAPTPSTVHTYSGESLGSLEVNDPQFLKLIELTAPIQKLASGFAWAEGPIWIKPGQGLSIPGSPALRQGGYLLFSDIPSNTVYRWQEGDGIHVFLHPSGYTGATPRGGEPGSNGLTTDPQGRLVLCEHGDRRIGRLESNGRHVTLVDRYLGRRFNSPNDLVYKSNGDLYFTDPPYGLERNVDDPKKELSFQGVFRLAPNGELTLLTDQMSRPNGLAFSPDEKTLYVANSDTNRAVWMTFPVKPDGTLAQGRVLFDATPMVKAGKKGLPDGMKVDVQGNLFAAGPGGVLVFSPDGRRLGTVNTGEPTANCAWGDDGSVLYITANHYLCRVQTKTRGKP